MASDKKLAKLIVKSYSEAGREILDTIWNKVKRQTRHQALGQIYAGLQLLSPN